MGDKLSELDREDGWATIEEGGIPQDRLEEWIKDYFNVDEDLKGFKRRHDGNLFLQSFDSDRGYAFFGEFQLDRDHEGRMMREKICYEQGLKRSVLRVFVDNRKKLSGFYWEGSK